MSKITSFGELIVDVIGQERKDLKEVENFSKRPGGAPANFAVACSKLGVKTTLISKVGNDKFGDFLLESVKKRNVDISQIERSDKKTTLAFVSLDENSVPDFMFYRKGCADTHIKTEEVNIEEVRKSDLFHFGSLSLTTEPIRSTLFEVLDKINGDVKISCDPNLRKDLMNKKLLENLSKALKYVNYLIVSDEELSLLTEGGSRREKAMELIERFDLNEVINTRGEQGSDLYKGDMQLHADSISVKPVDTTGAGDAFAAGYLTSLIEGKKPEERLKIGNIVGACCVKKKGGMSSLPDKNEIKHKKRQR